MSEPVLLVDLDGTLTREELLPIIARDIGLEEEIGALTADTLAGRVPFDISFRRRVELLADVPIERVNEILLGVPVFEELVALMRERPERALVVTGNLDVWVQPWLDAHGLRGLTATARTRAGRVVGVEEILHKGRALAVAPPGMRIAIGDGANDAPMVRGADLGIAWCGVHAAAPVLMDVAEYVFADEGAMCRFVRRWW